MENQAKKITELVFPDSSQDTSLDLFAYGSRVLKFSTTLQSTLDLNQTLVNFAEQLQSFVPFGGFVYENKAENFRLVIGKGQVHALSYILNLNNETLGKFRVSRILPFTDNEIQLVEQLGSLLLHPLRNALQYNSVLNKSLTDPLTGVNNRSGFNEEFEREVKLSHRHHSPLSLMVVDIDDFKQINDNYGHTVGDLVLQETCQVISQSLRTTDKLFRFGGEEFTVLLTETGTQGAAMLANRARANVAANRIEVDMNQIQVTISVGLATLATGEEPCALFKRADQAVYQAKHNGKNQIIING